MSGEADPGPARRASWSRCAPRARRSPRCRAWSRRCSATRVRIEVPGPVRRHRRHRRRPAQHRQHLHDGGARRGRRRRPSGQARQPGGVVGVAGRPTCWRRSASGSTCRPERVAAVAEQVGHHVLLRPAVPPRDAARRPVARRELGVPTAFNFLGPLTNPAQPGASAVGVADPRMAPVVAGVLAARGAQRPGVPRRRRSRRADDDRPVPGLGGVRGGASRPSTGSTRPSSACARATLDDLRGGDAAHQRRRSCARLLAGEPGPVRDAVLLNAGGGRWSCARGTATAADGEEPQT